MDTSCRPACHDNVTDTEDRCADIRSSEAMSKGRKLLSHFYTMQDEGLIPAGTPNAIVSSIVAYGFVRGTTQCSQGGIAKQSLHVYCDNPVMGELVRNNPNCQLCTQQMALLLQQRSLLEQRAHSQNAAYVMQELEVEQVKKLRGSDEQFHFGSCAYVCNQCVTENIAQNLTLRLSSACDLSSSNFRAAFLTGMSERATEVMGQYEGALQKMGVDAADTGENLSVHVVNVLQNVVTTSMLRVIHQQALVLQRIEITPQSTSLVANNLSQSLSVGMVSSMLSSFFSDAFMKTVIDHRQNTSYSALYRAFVEQTKYLQQITDNINTLMKDSIWSLIWIAIGVVSFFLLIFGGLVYFRPVFLFGPVPEDEEEA